MAAEFEYYQTVHRYGLGETHGHPLVKDQFCETGLGYAWDRNTDCSLQCQDTEQYPLKEMEDTIMKYAQSID